MNPRFARKIFTGVTRNKFSQDEGDIVLDAVNALVDFVKPTLGPKVKHILVHHGLRAEIRDDGKKIAEEMLDAFDSEAGFTEYHEAVAKFVVEVLQRTDDKVGDGTTTSAVLLQALLNSVISSGKRYNEFKAELEKGLEEVEAALAKKAKKIESEEDLFKVAMTSVLDPVAAKVIASTLFNVGSESAVTIEKSPTLGISSERAEGFEFGRGWVSPYMVNDPEHAAAVVNDPMIVVFDGIVSNQQDVIRLFELAETLNKRDIFVLAQDFMGDALNLMIFNRMKNNFNTLCVKAPLAGEPMREYLFDVALVTGAKVIGGGSGTKLRELTADFVGSAEKIMATREDTMIINGAGSKEEIEKHIKFLKTLVEEQEDPGVKEGHYQRMARLLGGVAVIRVGAATETELEAKLDKVEDAVNASKAALEEGIMPGGGVALLDIETSSPILNEILKAPFLQICENAGVTVEPSFGPEETFDANDGRKGNYLELGVVDSVKVIKTALRNAISVTSLLANVTGIIANKRQRDDCCHQKQG